MAVHTNSGWIRYVKFFQGCPQDFIIQVALALEPLSYPPMEMVLQQGDKLQHIYIITKGVVVARGRVYTQGKVFGEETLYREVEATYGARSMTFSDINLLSRTALDELLRSYPSLKVSFHK